jgi:AcrR family transcriptional regulator
MSPVARKKRRPDRRDQILEAAVRLFHERGFHATGMDDIGQAAGITGPAIYRHFESKEEILTHAVSQLTEERFVEIEEIVASSGSARDTLEQLARNHVRASLRNPALSAVVIGERRVFGPSTRARVDEVIGRRIDEWVRVLRELRPELGDADGTAMVWAVFTLFASVTQYDSGLVADVIEDLLVDMALDALLRTPVRSG